MSPLLTAAAGLLVDGGLISSAAQAFQSATRLGHILVSERIDAKIYLRQRPSLHLSGRRVA